MTLKVAIIIQARMGSTRLPGKMMELIGDKPVIWHVVERCKKARLANQIILATTTNSEDNVLADWAEKEKVGCYRGSSEDVLDRYYRAAVQNHADVIVRVTGDCPLADPEVIDLVIGEYLRGGYDYVCNTQPPTFPDGLDTEVFSFNALEKAWKEADLKSEREHVTPFIWKNTKLFTIKNIQNEVDLSANRWTLDTAEDLDFIRLVSRAIQSSGKSGGYKDIMKILDDHPEWQLINSAHKRNEGYAKSLNDDCKSKP